MVKKSKSVLKRQRQNIKKKIYNKKKYNNIKTYIKEFKKELIENKNLEKKNIFKKLYILYSRLDKFKRKKIIHFKKIYRIKSKLSNLINKYLAH
ncbi:MAG: 30S ribosomal protein S20 [Candidatus Shikimatogenerans sp. JK-2022]|nr:30S ribosomal protein S20 [Candidatus Shikimatogenerans bostrichidophilus]